MRNAICDEAARTSEIVEGLSQEHNAQQLSTN